MIQPYATNNPRRVYSSRSGALPVGPITQPVNPNSDIYIIEAHAPVTNVEPEWIDTRQNSSPVWSTATGSEQPVLSVEDSLLRAIFGAGSPFRLRGEDDDIASDNDKDDVESMSEVDAKIAAAEARTDAKLAQQSGQFATAHAQLLGEIATMRAELGGKIDQVQTDINGRLSHVEDQTKGLRSTIWLAALSVIGIAAAATYGAISYGAAEFSNGMSAQNIASQAAQEATKKYDGLEKKLDDLIGTINSLRATPTPPMEPAPSSPNPPPPQTPTGK